MRKNINSKIFALILAFLMILSQSFFAFADADTEDAGFSSRLSLLTGLGLADKTSFENPSDGVTRSEFVKIIIKYLGYSDFVSTATDEYFADVDVDHPYAEYIYTGKNLGILNGFSDGKFYPDSTVTFDQAIKVITCSLGYDTIANAKGGYPTGYKAAATENGILKGVKSGDPLTKSTLLKILENTLEAKVLSQTSLNSKGSIKLEKTGVFREVYHEIYKESGAVTATEYNADYSYSLAREGYVAIGDTLFSVGGVEGMSGLYGYSIDAYYTYGESDSFGTLLYANVSDKNEIVTVSASDIRSAVNNTLTYSLGGSSSSKTISYKGITVVYNGKTDYVWSDKDFKPEVGEVTFLDNNNDGKYEYAFIFSASKNILLSDTAEETDKIYVFDKITSTSAVTLSTEPENYSVERNGKKSSISELSENDVILLGISKDKDYYVLKAASNSVSGEISSVTNDSVIIDSKEYDLQKNYKTNASKIESDYYEDLQPLTSATVYLDVYGEVALIQKTEVSSLKYGVVMGLESIADHNEFQPWSIKVFTEDGIFAVLELPEKLMFNGSRTDAENVIKKLYEGDSIVASYRTDSIRQLITYKLEDESDVLKELYTRDYPEKLEYNGSFAQTKEYDYYLGTWGRKYYKGTNTKIFAIYADEDYCKMETEGSYKAASDAISYFYNVDESLNAGAVIRYYAGSGSSSQGAYSESQGVVIAKAKVKAVDYNETVSDALEAYTLDGTKVTIMPGKYTNEYVESRFKAAADDFNEGDIYFYQNDALGSLTVFERVIDCSDKDTFGSNPFPGESKPATPQTPSVNGRNVTRMNWNESKRWGIFGKVDKVVGNYIIFQCVENENGDLGTTREIANGVKTVMVKISASGEAEIEYSYNYKKAMAGDRIFSWGKWGVTNEIVLFRYE